MVTRIRFNDKVLESWGSHSLIGTIMKQSDNKLPEEVKLVFPQTTTKWREQNGGPLEYIITEYAIPCLIEDILTLINKGIKVSVEMPEKE